MVLSQFWKKYILHSAVYTISHAFFGGEGDKTFPKFDESFAGSFAKILAKFHELKISKKTTTLVITYKECFKEGRKC